jgi:AraC-like DNA-binding protein
VDILYLRGGGKAALQAVGAMTRVHTVVSPPDLLAVGVRFRPGAARVFLKLPLGEATDTTIPLEDIWNSRAKRLSARLSDSASIPEIPEAMESALGLPGDPTPAQRSLLALPQNRELWNPDELARQSGFSPRHFRRLCLDETGLTPKRLCRILRFRQTLGRIHPHPRSGRVDFARLAVDAGYYDQAHLIREFRELAGCPPSALVGANR